VLTNRISVEISPIARYITVTKNKITIPRVIRSKIVVYKATASPIIMFLAILIFALMITSISLLGFLAILLLILSLAILWRIDLRRVQKEEAVLRSILPEEKVLEILDTVVKICNETNRDSEKVQVDSFELKIRCGYPYKCAKYESRNLKKFLALYISIGLALIIGYLALPIIYLVLISIASLFIAIYTYRIPICEEFLVKKEKIEFKIED